MKNSIVTRLIIASGIYLIANPATAELSWRSRYELDFLKAEHILVCSDFALFDASFVSRFLSDLDHDVTSAKILDGPTKLTKARTFNVLFVITGEDVQTSTADCASQTAPYGDKILQEVAHVARKLKDGFEHPDPQISATLGQTTAASTSFFHPEDNWATFVVATREQPSGFTLIRLFSLPNSICQTHPAC